MSILVDSSTRVLVQGITGRQAQLNTLYMRAYGTSIVAGVTPGRRGSRVADSIPVYDSVAEALESHPEINTALLYVPPKSVKAAALESIRAGIPLVLVTTERCPQQDVMEIIAHARERGVRVVGPNSIGVVTPDECVIGLIGGRVEVARAAFRRGPVGVMSRSGGQTTTVCHYLSRAGIGQTTAVGIGGDPFSGTSFRDLLALYEKDPATKVVAAFGEVGTFMEEEAADFARRKGFRKPWVCYVAGRYVEKNVRYGHAGALVSHGIGDVRAKIRRLRACGVQVLEHLDDLAAEVNRLLKKESSG